MMDLQSANFWSRALAGASAACGPAIRIMEVCGSHTHAIARNSLRELLPSTVKLLSGPGCPICVSGALFIEKIRALLQKKTIVTLFGDLLRIPGSRGTLPAAKNLQVVYSPEDALDIAQKNPDKEVIFAAVGFAPTLAAAAALLQGTTESGIKNFSLLTDFKELTPVLHILCSKRTLSGLLLPGHVASITGTNSFKNLPVPAVISGFEPENILHSIQLLLQAVS
ncbi:MAG: hydrogenase formation protein HypD, partial [Lentisphaeria bacterium]|nr:hydrogenase formation protein HypD [Lentisphaeria bacterium]